MKLEPKIILVDRVRQIIRLKNYSYSTEKAYVYWIKRFILFLIKRYPKTKGCPEIETPLSYPAVERNVSVSTHTVPVSFRENQALCPILFLYRDVLGVELNFPIVSVRAKRPERLPTVLTRLEFQLQISVMSGKHQLMTKLLYGGGLRLMGCIRPRIKDIGFGQHQVIVRDGKGFKDRITVFPDTAARVLHSHLRQVKLLFEDDLVNGFGGDSLPHELAAKYPNVQFEWKWQYVFPSKNITKYPRSGELKRHHANRNGLQKAIKRATIAAGIDKHVTLHALRHSFATQLHDGSYDIRAVNDLLGHKHVTTIMIYTHDLNREAGAVHSPLDKERECRL